jgi:hypothetical protein
MSEHPLLIDDSDYVLLPSVTHPQGRARAFADAIKATVRLMVEVNQNPTLAYAIDKTDRIITTENMSFLSEEELDEWNTACDEFDAMSWQEQYAWVNRILGTYPKIGELPDLDGYNHLN